MKHLKNRDNRFIFYSINQGRSLEYHPHITLLGGANYLARLRLALCEYLNVKDEDVAGIGIKIESEKGSLIVYKVTFKLKNHNFQHYHLVRSNNY